MPDEISVDMDDNGGQTQASGKLNRQEIQRRHRERVRQAKEEAEGKYQQLRVEADQLKIENEALTRIQKALTQLDDYSKELHAFCESVETTQDDTKLSEASILDELEEVLLRACDDDRYPRDQWVTNVYFNLPSTTIISMERSFLNHIDRIMSQYRSSSAMKKESLENKLTSLFSARRRVGLMMLESRPDVHQKIISNVMPSATAPSRQTMALVDALKITEDQALTMLPAWLEYAEKIQSLQTQADEARSLLVDAATRGYFYSPADSEMVPSGNNNTINNNNTPIREPCLANHAIRLLETTAAVSFLGDFSKKLIAAYGRLTLQICGGLTSVQHAQLLLACNPCLPDYLQICTYLLDPLLEKKKFDNGARN